MIDLQLNIKVITIEQILIKKSCRMITLPASEGEVGIMNGHSPIIFKLTRGIIKIYETDLVTNKIVIDSGFAQVTADECIILTEQAINLTDLNKTFIKDDLSAKKSLTNTDAKKQLEFLEFVESVI